MAVNEYLQAAAAQLENAANALRSEMDQVRADYMNFEQQANRDITSMEADMRAAVARATTAGEPAGIAHHTANAAQLKKRIEDLKKQIDQRQRQMQDQIRSKEGAMSGLMSQSRSLQGQASNFK